MKADDNSNANFDVGVYVDGRPISGKGDLDKDAMGGQNEGVKNLGADIRTVSTENIESMEVVMGVPSAEYGDMASGAVIITTKKGRTPFEVRFKTDPKIKSVALGKGFGLGDNSGFLNVNVDYTNAFEKPWTSKNMYNRYTASVTYSNVLLRKTSNPLDFNFTLSGYQSGIEGKADQDEVKEGYKAITRKRNVAMNLFGTWQFNKPWITNLKYTFSASFSDDFNHDASFNTLAAGSTRFYATEPGEHLAVVLPTEGFFLNYKYSSKPVVYHGKISGNLIGRYGNVVNKVLLGAEFSSTGNTGRGRYSEEGTYHGKPIFMPQSFRPYPFTDIPFMNNLSVFAEDRVTLPFGKTSLDLEAGVRASNMMVKGYDNIWTVEPRLRARYTLVNRRNGGLRMLAIRGSWGKTSNTPSIDMLCPQPQYTDIATVITNYANKDMSLYNTFITTTEDRRNPNLKPVVNNEFEAAVDFNLFGIKGNVTYYNEKGKNYISYLDSYIPTSIDTYYVPADIVNDETKFLPMYDPSRPEGQRFYNAKEGYPIESTKDYTYYSLSTPTNNAQVDKWGVEFSLDFGRIEAIRTSILLNGAYKETTRRTNGALVGQYTRNLTKVGNYSVSNPYSGIFEDSSIASNGRHYTRFNTNLTFNTHIPQLRLVTSISIQAVWSDTDRVLNDGNLYYVNESGQRVYGHFYDGPVFDKNDNAYTIYKDPVYYMDASGADPNQWHKYTEDSANDPELSKLRTSLSTTNVTAFVKNSYGPYFMANLRITKEIGDAASVSFYCQNFTNSKPLKFQGSNLTYRRMNTDIYFGAELRLKF